MNLFSRFQHLKKNGYGPPKNSGEQLWSLFVRCVNCSFSSFSQGKKQKEQQKLQKKIKKKDSKAAGQSESGTSLSDFAMSPNNPSVPHFIEKCVEFIEAEGMVYLHSPC